MSKTITEVKRETQVLKEADVVVIGGGPGGWSAAVTSARQGAKTILIERYGFLGGMGTAANVNQWSLRVMASGIREKEPIVQGLMSEVIKRMIALDGVWDPSEVWTHRLWREIRWQTMFPFDPEVYKIVTLDLVQESGVDLLLHSFMVDVIIDGDKISGVIIQNKAGRYAILGKVFVDATGDASVAAASGVRYDIAKHRLGGTLLFWLGNVDLEKARNVHDRDKMAKLISSALEKGDLPGGPDLFYSPTVKYSKEHPYAFGFGMVYVPEGYPKRYSRQGEVRVWAAHVPYDLIDITDPVYETKIELFARNKMKHLVFDFLRKYVPGFEQAYIVSSGAEVGVRETRRIVGLYTLTGEDVRKGHRFEDVIARGLQEEFVHGYSVDPEFCPPHDIPYRCLIPVDGIKNLLVSGRCISLDSVAATLHSPRTQETCVAIGQAVGVAAKSALEIGGVVKDVNIKMIQDELRRQGANLGKD